MLGVAILFDISKGNCITTAIAKVFVVVKGMSGTSLSKSGPLLNGKNSHIVSRGFLPRHVRLSGGMERS